ncbi:MAG: DUF3726 domain-containing protein [Alphaproteobacteria bacterium]|nr:DUF3726 domain-containing protein [Alphaproteobacteria bacterium]
MRVWREGAVHVSLNEVRTLVAKAAVGSGLPVGTAAEIGHAAAWLVAVGEDGIGASVAGLSAKKTSSGSGMAFHGPGTVDLLLSTASGTALAVESADAPVLLVGLIGQALARDGREAEVTVSAEDGASVQVRGDGVSASPDILGSAPQCPCLILTLHSGQAGTPPAAADGVLVDAADWRRLSDLAARTLVPADTSSRDRGAGAGDIDNE